MTPLRLMMLPVAFTGGLSGLALAEEGGLSPDRLDALHARGEPQSRPAYRQLEARPGHLALEARHDDAWQATAERLMRDGTLTARDDAAAWQLSGTELTRTLDTARHAPMQRFASLAVDSTGHVEIGDPATSVHTA
ncbi:hypothetical protein [Modicisalibacter tunisiensis]|uniref:Uncharacterized protein n=1 Tax=Modicisalibacter tunisiensis TaxID=390637 RepID=A0ABS7WV28_9GAMM|nr:hypothetical protein [Modicisalibacter tunisiensis]MBZ9540139.1 hypothetical protein [Modicisalibacter tunisiensis]MBZ9566465.1 hypothetical protein [Modicisalibacter tunisiensis]